MAFTKFATFAVLSAELSGAKGSRKVAFVRDAHRHEFQYEPRPGFLYVRSRAISSRCNDNYDEFPASEIRQAYASFVGKPVFVNHHNENHRRARGVIIDAALHEDTNPDGSPDTWCEVLMEVDAMKFPKLAQAILAGHIDRTSMGTDVEYSLCSFCGNKASTPLEYCQHIPRLKGKKIRRTTASGEKTDVLVREICYGLRFFENSLLVEEPADPTAFFLGVDTRGIGQVASAGNDEGRQVAPSSAPSFPQTFPPFAAKAQGLDRAASLIREAFEDDKKRKKRVHYVFLPKHHEHAHGLLYDLMQGNDNCADHHESINSPGNETTADFNAQPGTDEWDREAINRLSGQGGFSVHRPNGDEPTSGYMCADGQNEQVVSSLSALTPEVIKGYLDKHASLLSRNDYYFGGWLDSDTGKVYLDISQHFSDLNSALNAARSRGELAVYDIGTGESVYVKDHQRAASLSKAASLVSIALATEQHDPATRSEYIGKCEACNGKFCWPNASNTAGVRSHQSDTRFRCPNISCDGTVKQTVRTSGPFTHIEENQVSSLQRFAYGETMAPAQVDTLRDEYCPVCKESDSFDGDRCQVCGYEQPPSEFTDPNTDIAKGIDLRQDADDTTGDPVEGDLECTNCGNSFASETGAPEAEATPIDPETPVDANGQPTVPEEPEQAEDPANPNVAPQEDENNPDNKREQVNPATGEPQKGREDEAPAVEKKVDDDNAAKPDADPATDPAKVLDSNRTPKSPHPDVAVPNVPNKSSDPAKAEESPAKGTEDGTSTNPKAGDNCPDCGEGVLQQKSPSKDDEGAPPAKDGADDSDQADDQSKSDGKKDDDDGDKSDGDKKPDDKDSDDDDKKNSPPWLKNKKSSRDIEGTEVDMRPALAALAEQQKVIEKQAGEIDQLKRAVATMLQLAGIDTHPKIASLFVEADAENPAQPIPDPGSEAPVETTDQARAPEATDNVEDIGSTPLTDVSPDATTSPTEISTTLDEPLDLNEENVEAPVAGTEGPRPESETRIETDVRAGTGDNTTTMNPWTLSSKSEGRTFASLRLARLRMQAGIEEGQDDISVAQGIETSAATDEAIQSEIETLSKVLTASKKIEQPRNLVPQGTNKTARTVPSFASEEQPLIREALMVSGPSDDEFAFE